MLTLDFIIGAITARILRWLAIAGISRNMDEIMNGIWMGGYNNPRIIKQEGFDAVLDLRKNVKSSYQNKISGHNIEYLNIKIPDRESVPLEVLENVANWIEKRKGKGKKILIHCNLGRGRAALALSAYLLTNGQSVLGVLEMLKSKRSVVHLNEKQRCSLDKFYESLNPQ